MVLLYLLLSGEEALELTAFLSLYCLSSSVQRSVYKDIVLLLQKDKYLTLSQLKSKVSDVHWTNIYMHFELI